MQAQYYSDKSIAVFGETKPWAGNLKELGGKFNANLGGKPGWIFAKTKEADIMNFLALANARQIAPIHSAYTPPMQNAGVQIGGIVPMVPIGAAPVAMNPAQAMARLQLVSQGTLPSIAPLTLNTQQPLPQVSPSVALTPLPPLGSVVKSPTTIKPVTSLPTTATTLHYPNNFTAADGLNYQIVISTLVIPKVDQQVSVNFTNGEKRDGVITDVKDITSMFLVKFSDSRENDPEVFHAFVYAGQWKIMEYLMDSASPTHEVIFS